MKKTRPVAERTRSPRNRTLRCSEQESAKLGARLLVLTSPAPVKKIKDKIINQNIFDAAPRLPSGFVDLLILDPPYNLTKNYHGKTFPETEKNKYAAWFEKVIRSIRHTLKPAASVYVCADWRTSIIVAPILEKYFQVKNRITWEREKGRGAKFNWKNNIEDIWFCVTGGEYFFNVDAVKLKRKVMAPYRQNGRPKDWREEAGGNYRLTHPSNVWTDISIPFWSMPENTDHPTQKPEKLLAKLILASSRPGDMIFDPFMGSGTTAVTAKKLRRRFVCVELNREYCCWGQKRLLQAASGDPIQGYAGHVFWERNTFGNQPKDGDQMPAQETLL
ncbi:MAG: site-specific DNA-methyltransferase [Gammaproteobacteria bacterium]|nr:site-specific DNA-methyltransferase [Gammaproteobacteria bacterium]